MNRMHKQHRLVERSEPSENPALREMRAEPHSRDGQKTTQGSESLDACRPADRAAALAHLYCEVKLRTPARQSEPQPQSRGATTRATRARCRQRIPP